jgi:hypothetical protein
VGNWKRRWFVLALTDTHVTVPTSTSTDVGTSATIRTATLCYYKDASKLELKGSHTLSSTSGIVGLDSDPHTDAHAHMKPHVKHAFRFKLLAAGSDVVLDADSASDRLKWILAIESIVLELPTHAQSNAHSQAHSQTDPLTHTLGAGSSSSLLRTGSDLTDYVSRYNSKDPKHAPLGFKLDKQTSSSLSASINDDAHTHALTSTPTTASADAVFIPTYTQIDECADNDDNDECDEDDCYYDRDGNIHSSLSVETNQSSSEFMFRALSSEDGSTGDRTSVDSSANTQAPQRQPKTPTRRQTHTNTNTNTNNQSSPVKVLLTTEQRLLHVSESFCERG